MSASKAADITANPFDEQPTRLNEYTAQQIAALQSRLDKRLGPEYLSTRQGPGGQRVHYIAADKCISLANEVFGFNGWSSSIQNIQVDFVDEERNGGKVTLGLSVIMRVTLKDGTFHEDVGYGQIENCKGKAAAFEKAKKEGTTDALKRTLRTFGNVLGNCIYDKEYLSRVTKVKPIPTKWDVDDLHRPSELAPVKKEPIPSTTSATGDNGHVSRRPQELPPTAQDGVVPAEFEGEFGSDLFDEADFSEQRTFHPDEVVLDQQPQNNVGHGGAQGNHSESAARAPSQLETPSKPQKSDLSADAPPVSLPPAANNVRPTIPPANQFSTPVSKIPSARPQPGQQNNAKPTQEKPAFPNTNIPPSHPSDTAAVKPDSVACDNDNGKNNSPTKPSSPSSSQLPEDKRPGDPEGGFYSGRAAEALKSNPYNASKSAPTFDPRLDSPSIRKTAGFNHNTSAPVARHTYQILGPKNGQQPQDPDSLTSGAQSPSINNAQNAIRNPAGATTNGRGNSLPKIEPVATFTGPAKSPMTTSYRPPTRRSMAEGNNNNVNQAPNTSAPVPPPPPPPQTHANATSTQNVNGKRPPLSDATNLMHTALDEKGNHADMSKKTKLDEGGGGAAGTGTAVQQGQQVSRPSGATT